MPLRSMHVSAGAIAVMLSTGCDTVEYRIHEFSEVSVEAGSGIEVTINAYGTWHRMDADQTIDVLGSPYVIDVRISLSSSAEAAEMVQWRAVDVETGESLTVSEWDAPIVDQATREIVLVNRSGLVLPYDTLRVEMAFAIPRGEGADTVTVTDTLNYHYRTEHRLRLLERLRGA